MGRDQSTRISLPIGGLQTTRDEFVAQFGRTPPLLEEAIRATIPPKE